MSDGIYSALSGAIAQERNLSVTANNVANVTTTGYKADKTIFAEVLSKVKSKLPAAPSLRYTTVSQLAIDQQTGSLKQTGRPLDVALHGEGYFVVRTPEGERYTRDGSFVLDQQGVVRTLSGLEVLKEDLSVDRPGRRIEVPNGTRELVITPNGEIHADGAPLARFKLVRFDKPDDALREGLTLFTTQAGVKPKAIDPNTSLEQGFLESANVNAITGMNELIIVSRSFEALEKVIETFRDLDNRTARDVGGRV